MSIKDNLEEFYKPNLMKYRKDAEYVESLYDKNGKPTDENVSLEEEDYIHEDENGSGLHARQWNSNSYKRNQKQKIGRGGWCRGGWMVYTSLQVNWKDTKFIKDLYIGQEAIIRIAGGESRTCIIGKGVRQGCPLSPLLFSKYAEMLTKKALDDVNEGVQIKVKILKDVRFADDQGMVANSEKGLQVLINHLVETAKKYDMKQQRSKTLIQRKPRP